jgi:hypothetical protein
MTDCTAEQSDHHDIKSKINKTNFVRINAKGKFINLPVSIFNSDKHHEKIKHLGYMIDADHSDLYTFMNYISDMLRIDNLTDATKMKIGYLSYIFGHNNIYKMLWLMKNCSNDEHMIREIIDDTINFEQSFITTNNSVVKKISKLMSNSTDEYKNNVLNFVRGYENWIVVMIDRSMINMSEKIPISDVSDFIDNNKDYIGKKIHKFIDPDKQHDSFCHIITAIDQKCIYVLCPLNRHELQNLIAHRIVVRDID